MNGREGSPLTSLVRRFLPRLRYPYLFLVLVILFLVDLVTPDPVPMIDELILAILTVIAASLTTRNGDSKAADARQLPDRAETSPSPGDNDLPSTGE